MRICASGVRRVSLLQHDGTVRWSGLPIVTEGPTCFIQYFSQRVAEHRQQLNSGIIKALCFRIACNIRSL